MLSYAFSSRKLKLLNADCVVQSLLNRYSFKIKVNVLSVLGYLCQENPALCGTFTYVVVWVHTSVTCFDCKTDITEGDYPGMDETTYLYTVTVFLMSASKVVNKNLALVKSCIMAFSDCWQSPHTAVSAVDYSHK